jgi:hypothetical protein
VVYGRVGDGVSLDVSDGESLARQAVFQRLVSPIGHWPGMDRRDIAGREEKAVHPTDAERCRFSNTLIPVHVSSTRR